MQKVHSDFELHGIDEERLNNKSYSSIMRRLQLEETNCALNENGTGGSATNRVGNNRVVSYSPGVYNDPGKFLIIERGYPVTKTTHFALGDDEHEIIVNNAAGNTNITFPLASRHPGRRAAQSTCW